MCQRGAAVSSQHLEIRELAAWGLDNPVDRGLLASQELQDMTSHALRKLETCRPYREKSPIAIEESHRLSNALADRKPYVRESGEFDRLTWQLAVVDLRRLIAFQRRIGFPEDDSFEIEQSAGWRQLLDLALPVHAQSRSPYVEVASYRGRWFLRDGYHRSFRLLNRGIHFVPAVLVQAETLTQMGAVGSQFFAEEILFSRRPPMVEDFLDDEMVLRYLRSHRDDVVQPLREPVQAGS
jgi:hypothetical protein